MQTNRILIFSVEDVLADRTTDRPTDIPADRPTDIPADRPTTDKWEYRKVTHQT